MRLGDATNETQHSTKHLITNAFSSGSGIDESSGEKEEAGGESSGSGDDQQRTEDTGYTERGVAVSSDINNNSTAVPVSNNDKNVNNDKVVPATEIKVSVTTNVEEKEDGSGPSETGKDRYASCISLVFLTSYSHLNN